MSDESGLPISKPVSLLKKSIKVNFQDFSKAVGKAGVDAAFGKWDSLAGDGVDALAALGLSAGVGEIGWLLVYRSLLQAMKDLVDEKTELEPEKFDLKALRSQVDTALETSSLSINKKFFEHPDKDPIVEVVKPPFINWLKQFGLSEAEAEAISHRLPIYFAAALHKEWGDRPKDYAVLKEKLDTPFTQANDRMQAWLRYSTWLQKQIEEPIFLEAFSLKQVYVPLRAYYKRKIEGKKGEDLEERLPGNREYEQIVVNLERELEAWLTKADRLDAIRLISGGPGSGKSSFAKMFAAKQAEKSKLPVLFIPLHHFEPSADLIDAVEKFVRFDGFLPYNPLDLEKGEPRLLIIFDGLDELAMQGKIAEKTAQDFVREVQRKVERLNYRESRLQVLISGRELVVQANSSDFRQPQQILHILPYFVAEDDRENYTDPKKLLKQDQRQLWWQLYGRASGREYAGLPQELDQGNLIEVTAQPLLNYLVALSLQRGELEFSEETNLNAIYADLLTAIYERGWAGHQHAAIQGIEEKDFIRILEEIALASWHGDGRTTTVGEIEKHCNNSGLKALLQRFQAGFREESKANVTRLLTAFYFRQSGYREGEKTFEFTHKSFGEYLTAKRIVREVGRIHKEMEKRQLDPDEGWDERDALYHWLLVCSDGILDSYLCSFILDEMRLRNLSDISNWQMTLCKVMDSVLRYSMPMERLASRNSFWIENFKARNAETALLVALNACARLTKIVSEIQSPYMESFGDFISRLNSQRSKPDELPLMCLSFLSLQDSILYVKDFYRANLEKTNLDNARLNYSNLIEANLEQASCESTFFIKANLELVNFEKAHLLKAVFSQADLRDANLFRANLEEANLELATLMRANFKEASLVNADLRGANLWQANLEGVDLRRANLEYAQLQEANLRYANLEGANLEKTDLEGANLEGANLKGTVLEGKVNVSSIEDQPTTT